MKILEFSVPFYILSAFSVSLSAEEWSAPWFCHGYECPRYTLISTYETFEERYYNDSRWMVTDIESVHSSDVYDGFMKLYKYFGGENEAGQSVEMTRPVSVTVLQTDGGEDRKVSIAFFVPPEADPPKPTGASIKSMDRPGGRVYVRSFGGVASEDRWLENVRGLQKGLEEAGKPYKALAYTAAGYDHPLWLINRHNEVWICAA